MTTADQNWLPFAKTFTKDYKIANVYGEQKHSFQTKYPMRSQREKNTILDQNNLFQNKTVQNP